MIFSDVMNKFSSLSKGKKTSVKKKTSKKVTGKKVAAKKNAGQKGASRSVKKKDWQPKISLNTSMTQGLVAVVFIVLTSVVYGSYVAVETVLDIPVNQVAIKGELKYQQEDEVAGLINQYVNNGFMSVDLKRLQQELVALPWVYKADLKRKLPNGLLIELEEQRAVAYWNDNAYINQYAQIFEPLKLVTIEGLPNFEGINHHNLLGVYKLLTTELAEEQKPIRFLRLDSREVVTVELATGVELTMNYELLDEQLARWSDITNKADSTHVYAMRSVDLRYSNGAAIAWKNTIAINNKTHVGGH